MVIGDANEGTDTVSWLDVSYTLGANVENLTLTGAANINGTGNALDQHASPATPATTSSTAAPAPTRMGGGAGNDTYVVDNAGDVVIENANAGTDTVQSSISYTLGANVENLTLTGAPASTAPATRSPTRSSATAATTPSTAAPAPTP